MLLVVVSKLLVVVLHLKLFYILPYWTVSSETELSSSGNTVVSQKSVFKEGEEEGGGEEPEVNPSRMTLWEKLLVVALISCSSRHAWKEGETKEYKSMK